ncbi:TetR/AcrR family transcriptional regulator [Butyrivibrio sp. DSM 10294]|uniref:TetR/AcrR family transcriptional regulator n=1 Tax=Butyrivibrio sp. DSM 10294 TaxID=2972457 RepID=UPI00234F1868|nr:TetR/AcrR family transcriptional regulator [Butyrivibrio sp. DSM 10294]MDC7293829.1 TetR/AcrR family transcriptional regulator [Butyrivibrio sp. DSM 10294]
MPRTNAKEPLIKAARDLFSEKGFDGTGVDEIAESIGIKGPTIYKYFKNKEDLLKAVIDTAEYEYLKGMGANDNLPDRINSGEDLKAYALRSLDFTLKNDTAKKMRKLITMEQYRNATLAKLTTRHQLTYLQDVYTSIFQKMMDRGQMVKGDAAIIALEFISPITIMVQLLDRQPRKKKEALQIVEKHIDIFLEKYEFI